MRRDELVGEGVSLLCKGQPQLNPPCQPLLIKKFLFHEMTCLLMYADETALHSRLVYFLKKKKCILYSYFSYLSGKKQSYEMTS